MMSVSRIMYTIKEKRWLRNGYQERTEWRHKFTRSNGKRPSHGPHVNSMMHTRGRFFPVLKEKEEFAFLLLSQRHFTSRQMLRTPLLNKHLFFLYFFYSSTKTKGVTEKMMAAVQQNGRQSHSSHSTQSLLGIATLLVVLLAVLPSYPSSAMSALSSGHHSLSKRSFFDINCKGLYDKSIFARLDRICQDCYNLYREPELHTLCR